MPTYDYYCSSCKETMEIFHSMSQADETICPKCKKSTLKKAVGNGSGVIFHGSGYYCTDYKKKSAGTKK